MKALPAAKRYGNPVARAARNGALEVRFQQQGKARTLRAARVANGTGRIPDVEELDLDTGGIAHEGPKIAHDEFLRSVSNPDIYVAGDSVADSAQLSPLATHEGRIVGENIVQGDHLTPDYRPVPAVVFSIPALASVGLTEARASEQGLRFEAKATDMSDWLSAELYSAEVAYAKVLVAEGSGRILGAHLVGKRAEELIHLFALAVKFDIPAEGLKSLVAVFPTFSSDMGSMV